MIAGVVAVDSGKVICYERESERERKKSCYNSLTSLNNEYQGEETINFVASTLLVLCLYPIG